LSFDLKFEKTDLAVGWQSIAIYNRQTTFLQYFKNLKSNEIIGMKSNSKSVKSKKQQSKSGGATWREASSADSLPFPTLVARPHEKIKRGTCVVNALVMRRFKFCVGQAVELFVEADNNDAPAHADDDNSRSNRSISVCSIISSTKIPASGL
jgi:hypothetical protein